MNFLSDGSKHVIAEETCNYLRLWRRFVNVKDCISLTLEPLETWGSESVRLFAFEAE